MFLFKNKKILSIGLACLAAVCFSDTLLDIKNTLLEKAGISHFEDTNKMQINENNKTSPMMENLKLSVTPSSKENVEFYVVMSPALNLTDKLPIYIFYDKDKYNIDETEVIDLINENAVSVWKKKCKNNDINPVSCYNLGDYKLNIDAPKFELKGVSNLKLDFIKSFCGKRDGLNNDVETVSKNNIEDIEEIKPFFNNDYVFTFSYNGKIKDFAKTILK